MKKIYLLLAILLLTTACSNDEQKARKLMNQAIQQWEADNYEEADKLFLQVESDYLHTQVATESIKQRQSRIQIYRDSLNMANVERRNKGAFSKQVYNGLTVYYQDHEGYPKSLLELNLAKNDMMKSYLSLCKYEKALFEVGFSLNCSSAEARYKSDRQKEVKSSASVAKTLNMFPKEKSRLGQRLNPQRNLPLSGEGFLAYYFDRLDTKDIFHETVRNIYVDYAYREFHNLLSNNFAAYWVGSLDLDKPTVKKLDFKTQGRSDVSIYIDNHRVYASAGQLRQPIYISLEAGKHTIEVEYINHWHTANFYLGLIDEEEASSPEELLQYFSQNKTTLKQTDLLYAGVRNNQVKNGSVTLNILPNKKPIVLILHTTAPTQWIIHNPRNVVIKAIIYNNWHYGTTISGDVTGSTKLFNFKEHIASHTNHISGDELKLNCKCSYDGEFQCNYSSNLHSAILEYTGHPLNGFSGGHNVSELDIPELIVDKSLRQTLLAKDSALPKRRAECVKNAEKDEFDKILESK